MKINEIVKKVEACGDFIEEGRIGQVLAEKLVSIGWTPDRQYSRCKVASYEACLEKNGTRVEIVEAVLFGPFTGVRAYKSK